MKKTSKIIIGIIVLVVVVWGGFKLFGAKSDKTIEPIKIGAIFPFTGSSGITGESSKNGLQLAVDEINSQGGINGKDVFVIYEDSQSKTDIGLSAYKKIENIDKIKFVFTSVSGVALAISPLANANKVIQIDVVSAAPLYSTPDDYTFRTGVNSYAFAGKMSELLASKGVNKIALLYINTEFGVGYKDVFNKEYTNTGGEIITIESFNQGDTDFKTQISKIKNSGAKALVLISSQKESPVILTQISQLKLSVPIYTDVYAAELQDNLKISSSEGVIYIKPAINNSTQFNLFKQKYLEKYGKNPDFIAAQSYDGFRLLSKALKKCNKEQDTNCIKNELYGIKDFDGVIGDKISFDINGDIQNRALETMTVKNGQFVKYEE